MSDREKRLEEIKQIISNHSSQLPEGCAERLSVQFANMMADDAWEDNDELPSSDALSAFLLWLMRCGDVRPGIGTNGRGSITAFYRDGDIKHAIIFGPYKPRSTQL
jgi:hypothetical protein